MLLSGTCQDGRVVPAPPSAAAASFEYTLLGSGGWGYENILFWGGGGWGRGGGDTRILFWGGGDGVRGGGGDLYSGK